MCRYFDSIHRQAHYIILYTCSTRMCILRAAANTVLVKPVGLSLPVAIVPEIAFRDGKKYLNIITYNTRNQYCCSSENSNFISARRHRSFWQLRPYADCGIILYLHIINVIYSFVWIISYWFDCRITRTDSYTYSPLHPPPVRPPSFRN